MPNRANLRRMWADTSRRNSQSSQYVGTVVDANATDGTILVRVGGRIVRCRVSPGATFRYGETIGVSRLPGSAMLHTNAATNVIIQAQAAAAATRPSGTSGTPPPTSCTPSTPTLFATAVSSDSIYLEWGSDGECTTYFLIERSADGDSYSLVASVPVEQTVYTDTGRADCTLYFYRVRATDGSSYSGYSNVAQATTLGGSSAVVATGTQLGLTMDITASSPEWIDVLGGITGAVSEICIAPDTSAWAISVGSDYDNTGVWFASSIVDHDWSLVLSNTAAWAQAGYGLPFITGCISGGYFYTAFSDLYYGGIHLNYVKYFWGANGALSMNSWPLSQGANWGAGQFGMSRLGYNGAWFGLGGNYDAGGAVLNLANGLNYHFTLNYPGGHNTRAVDVCGEAHCIGGSRIHPIAPLMDVDEYNDVTNILPLVEETGLWYVSNAAGTNGYLMHDLSTIANPETVFGSGRTGAGFAADNGVLVWVCANSGSGTRTIALTNDGGSSWSDKLGNWNSVLGAYSGSGSGIVPHARIFGFC